MRRGNAFAAADAIPEGMNGLGFLETHVSGDQDVAPSGLGAMQMLIQSPGAFSAAGAACVLISCFIGCSTGSDVLDTKLKEAHNQFAKWTPENIAKNPQLYLKFCEDETNKAIERMKANEISIQQKKATLEPKLREVSEQLTVGTKALAELKVKFREATGEGGSGFPVKWMNMELTEEKVKKQIMTLAGEVQSREKLKTMWTNAVAQLSKAKGDISLQRDKAKGQLANIAVSMETLKIQDISNELAGQLANMGGMLAGLVDFQPEDPNQIVGLDFIAQQSDSVVDDEKFDEIMGK